MRRDRKISFILSSVYNWVNVVIQFVVLDDLLWIEIYKPVLKIFYEVTVVNT